MFINSLTKVAKETNKKNLFLLCNLFLLIIKVQCEITADIISKCPNHSLVAKHNLREYYYLKKPAAFVCRFSLMIGFI